MSLQINFKKDWDGKLPIVTYETGAKYINKKERT